MNHRERRVSRTISTWAGSEITDLNAYAAISEGGGSECGEGSLSHAACHSHPAPPARQTRPAASARSLSAAEGRLGALQSNCPAEPRVAPGQYTALRGLRLLFFSSPHAPLPHGRGSGGWKGAERHTGRGSFLSFLSSVDLTPSSTTYTRAEQKHFQTLPAQTGTTFVFPRGAQRAQRRRALSTGPLLPGCRRSPRKRCSCKRRRRSKRLPTARSQPSSGRKTSSGRHEQPSQTLASCAVAAAAGAAPAEWCRQLRAGGGRRGACGAAGLAGWLARWMDGWV